MADPDFGDEYSLLERVLGNTTTESQCEKLDDIFAKCVPDIKAEENLITQNGRALQPTSAAACFRMELIRSIKFIKAGFLAIQKALEKFPERPIRVLEIGSGPYAPIATTLASLFPQGQVEFMALDVFKESIDCARRVAEVLGQAEKYSDFIIGDATKIVLPEGKRPHVAICETMSLGLQDEPQIQITANLADQVVEGGFFLPEEVKVSAFMTEVMTEAGKERFLGDIYILDKTISQRVKPNGVMDLERLEEELAVDKTFNIENIADPDAEIIGTDIRNILITTRLKIFGDIRLHPNEARITGNMMHFLGGSKKARSRKVLGIRVVAGLGTINKGYAQQTIYQSKDALSSKNIPSSRRALQDSSLNPSEDENSLEKPCEGNKNSIDSDSLGPFLRFIEKFMPLRYHMKD